MVQIFNLGAQITWTPGSIKQCPNCAGIVPLFKNSFKDRFLKITTENFGKFQENVYDRVYFVGLYTPNSQKKDSAADSSCNS